jgi:hypothetical protein
MCNKAITPSNAVRWVDRRSHFHDDKCHDGGHAIASCVTDFLDPTPEQQNVILVDAATLLVEYDPVWPALFRAESDQVRAALGSRVVRLEHVGLTSVPNLACKANQYVQNYPDAKSAVIEQILGRARGLAKLVSDKRGFAKCAETLKPLFLKPKFKLRNCENTVVISIKLTVILDHRVLN